MTARYVLNPLHVRRRDGYWIQVGPRTAVSWDGTDLLDRLRERAASEKTLTKAEALEWLGNCYPDSDGTELRATLRNLLRVRALVRPGETRKLPERFLRPTIRVAIGVLEKIRLQSYRKARTTADNPEIHWPPSIFNALGMEQRVFYSTLLIVASRLGFDYRLDYEDARHVRVLLRNDGVSRSFTSQFRYLPEADERGEFLAENKSLANYLCELGGIRVPKQWRCHSVSDASRFAARYGFPVVVKPEQGESGTDVYANLTTNAMLREVVPALLKKWRRRGGLVVEQYVPGNRYRLVILGSEIVESRAALPPVVRGDGKSTVRELIDRENRRRRREFTRSKGEAGIRIDARIRRYLKFQSYRLDSVVPRGREVQLHYTLNRATGARSEAIPERRIHPHVKRMAIKAVKLFGLHLAGVDYIAPNVSQSPEASGGKICEVQARPGVTPMDLDYEAFVEKLLRYAMAMKPGGTSARLTAR